MRIEKTVQKIIDLALVGVAGVYADAYVGPLQGYIVLETSKELAEFRQLVTAVKGAPRGTLAVITTLEELEKFVGRPCLPEYITLLYDEEKGWRQSPESLLDDEFDRRLWEANEGWFADQREHLAEMADPTPVVPDEPWRGAVVTLATEIAAREGRGPVEGDFNTALIQLRGEVPQEEFELLSQNLKAVEAGTSIV